MKTRASRYLSLVIASLFLATGLQAPAQARDYVPPGADLKNEDRIAFMVKDTIDGPTFVSLLRQDTAAAETKTLGNRWCLSFETENCSLSTSGKIQAAAILPVCKADEDNCIEGLKVYPVGSEAEPAQLVKELGGFQFPSLEKLGTPRGASPSVWKSATPHVDSESNYVVTVSLGFEIQDGTTVRYNTITAAVFPVVELTGSNYRPSEIQSRVIDGVTWWNHDNGEQGSDDGCVATESGRCWARTEFTPGTKVELSLRVTNQISGWLHGRVKDPLVSISPVNEKTNRFVIAAESVEVPVLYGEAPFSTQDATTQDLLLSRYGTGGRNGGKEWQIHSADSQSAKRIITQFAKQLNDKAAATANIWQLKSINSGRFPSSCLNLESSENRLAGIVTTNAMAYEGSAPQLAGGTLNYEVAGLHLLPDGSEAIGTYDLIVRSDVARCLYGFSKAPISATVSVVGTGDTKVSTTLVSEKNGWLKLAAYGFTFSQKTIKVKLMQPKQVVKKTTITCVTTKKPIKTRKVTAVSPKCPTGFKKK